MIKYILSEYGVTFIYELFFQVFKNFVVYVVECLPHSERCSDRTSQHCHTLQCSQKMCIRGCVKIVQSTTIWHSRKSWFSRFERAALSPLQWLCCNSFTTGPVLCHHCIPWPWKCGCRCTIFRIFDVLHHLIMHYGVDGGHLGKWRRVRIAHPSGDVITQFRDPHTSMIDFRHADKCWYSAAGTLLFWGPPLQHYLGEINNLKSLCPNCYSMDVPSFVRLCQFLGPFFFCFSDKLFNFKYTLQM